MKNDYLWDKSGDDPEIKRLEEVLAVFQYQETAEPTLRTAKIIPFPERPKRREYSYAFAIAACVTVVIILGVWFQLSRGAQPKRDLAQSIEATIDREDPREREVGVVDNSTEEIEKTAYSAEQPIPVRRARPAPQVRRVRKVVKNIENSTAVTLTSEEKFAYGQLLLALSITGSKLKIVQDKVNGIDAHALEKDHR